MANDESQHPLSAKRGNRFCCFFWQSGPGHHQAECPPAFQMTMKHPSIE
jgi:hypothetical protein